MTLEREPQQLAYRQDATIRGLWIAVDELGNGVEGVEEKVWMQLHPESLKLSLREAEFAFLVFTKVVECLTDGDDAPVDHDVGRTQAHEQRRNRHGRLVLTRPREQEIVDDL